MGHLSCKLRSSIKSYRRLPATPALRNAGADDHRGRWSGRPEEQSPCHPSVTCTAVPAGSSSGAAPGTRPDPTSAPGAAGPARPPRSLCSVPCRRPAWLRWLLSDLLLRAVAIAIAGLDLAPPESPLWPESHVPRRIGASPKVRCSAPAQVPASRCACVFVRVPPGAVGFWPSYPLSRTDNYRPNILQASYVRGPEEYLHIPPRTDRSGGILHQKRALCDTF